MIAFGIAIAIGGWWLVGGASVFTKTAQPVVVDDELFRTKQVQWEEGLWIGLDVAGPGILVLAVVGVLLWRRSRRDTSGSGDVERVPVRNDAQQRG